MTTNHPTTILESLRGRYSTKQFDASQSISAEIWETIEQSLVLTPSSFGLQPWKFIVVEDVSIRAALQSESWNQPQVTEASKFLVLTARADMTEVDIDEWIACLSAAQSRDPESLAPLRGMMAGFVAAKTPEQRQEWNVRQVYIALGQLMTTAAVLGIDACPMEGIDATAYDRILGLEGSGYRTAVACALGYRSTEDKYATAPKARFAKERVIARV